MESWDHPKLVEGAHLNRTVSLSPLSPIAIFASLVVAPDPTSDRFGLRILTVPRRGQDLGSQRISFSCACPVYNSPHSQLVLPESLHTLPSASREIASAPYFLLFEDISLKMARFRSISVAKRRSDRSQTPDTLYSMSSANTTSSSTCRVSEVFDTGFPDLPRTTNWRHPEADTSPDACISSEDVDVAKATHRHRRLFLRHKYSRTTSHGFILENMEQEYLKPKTADSGIGMEDGRTLVTDDGDARPSKDSTESIDRAKGHSPTSPATSEFVPNGGSPTRKKSIFSRIRDHRH